MENGVSLIPGLNYGLNMKLTISAQTDKIKEKRLTYRMQCTFIFCYTHHRKKTPSCIYCFVSLNTVNRPILRTTCL